MANKRVTHAANYFAKIAAFNRLIDKGGDEAKDAASAKVRLASVYAEHEKLKYAKDQDKKRKNLQKLRDQLTVLKEKLRATQSEGLRAELKEKISTQEQAIKKAPRPKRRGTLMLPGSFENGKRR